MITTFDLFGYKKYRYTFRPRCEEVPELVLKDGATRIFLNTKGKNTEEVSTELRDFLHYVEHTTDNVAGEVKSERIKRIHERVRKVKNSEEVGVKYMQAWEEKYYARQEALEEGIAAGIATGKAEDILEILNDLGTVPGEISLRIMGEKNLEVLKKWLKCAVRAKSLEEFLENM